MFDYDKVMKKLGKFDELSGKKQKKVFDRIFSTECKEWFYQVGESAKDQPMTPQMVDRLYNTLAQPMVMKRLTSYISSQDHEQFDHTCCSMAFIVVDQAVDAISKANEEVTSDYKGGSIGTKDAKSYKEKSEKYTEYVADLMNSLKDKSGPEVKNISKKTNLPKALVYTTYFLVPDRKYIPAKFKITYYMNIMLREIYRWVGQNGLDQIDQIRWGSLFGNYFGGEMTASAAISILLEGVKRIDPYKDAEYFDDVRAVWDSLTAWALNELEHQPENVRRQMIELYIKKIDRIYNHGHGPALRVNILQLPPKFSSLADTVSRYSNQISRITQVNMKPANDMVKKAFDNNRIGKAEELNRRFEDAVKNLNRDGDEEKVNKNSTPKVDDDDDDEPSFLDNSDDETTEAEVVSFADEEDLDG